MTVLNFHINETWVFLEKINKTMATTSAASFNRQTYPVGDKEPISGELVSPDESGGLLYRGRLYVGLEVFAESLGMTFDSAARILYQARHQPHFTFDVLTNVPDKKRYVSEESIAAVLVTRFAMREKGRFVRFVQPQLSNNGSSIELDGDQYFKTSVVADRLSITPKSAGKILYEGRHLDPYRRYDPSFSLRYISDRFLGYSYFFEHSVNSLVKNRFVLNYPDGRSVVCSPDSVEGCSEALDYAPSLTIDGVPYDGMPTVASSLDISTKNAERPLFSDHSRSLGWHVMHDCFYNHLYLRREDLQKTVSERFCLHSRSSAESVVVSAESIVKHPENGRIISCIINGSNYVSLSEAAPAYGVERGETLRRKIHRGTLYPYAYDIFLRQFFVPRTPSPHM